MARNIKRMAKLTLGWMFIILGVLGLFLPILQGVLFLCVGLTLLAQEQIWANKLIQKIRKKFPKAASKFDEGAEKAKEIWKKFLLSWPSLAREPRIKGNHSQPEND